VFFGTPDLAVPILAVVAGRHDVRAVVCQPDRPQGRSNTPVPPPVKLWAAEHGIPVSQPEKLNDGSFQEWLTAQAPGVCVVAAYGRLLRRPLLKVPTHGFINVHPSLLPRHRGPAPIQTAILMGDEVTGVTIIRLNAGMDAGDILLQREAHILPEDTTLSLTARLAELGAEVILQALALIESGRAEFRPQDEMRATYTALLEKEDGRIRWSASARDIHNLVRAATPWPAAHCRFRGELCRIHQTEVVTKPSRGVPGTIARIDRDRILVTTGEGTLAIRMLQLAGKRAMPVADFLRGHPVCPGEAFE
jgi:methionyl-tRNA formyltransferase